jgi:hypothetical protein
MKNEDLILANRLNNEIKELENFISSAENVWTGKIIKKEYTYIFKSNAYGVINSAEYNMNTIIKNRVLSILREYLNELKEELSDI